MHHAIDVLLSGYVLINRLSWDFVCVHVLTYIQPPNRNKVRVNIISHSQLKTMVHMVTGIEKHAYPVFLNFIIHETYL